MSLSLLSLFGLNVLAFSLMLKVYLYIFYLNLLFFFTRHLPHGKHPLHLHLRCLKNRLLLLAFLIETSGKC